MTRGFTCDAPCHYGGLSAARKYSSAELGHMWHCNQRVRNEGDRCWRHPLDDETFADKQEAEYWEWHYSKPPCPCAVDMSGSVIQIHPDCAHHQARSPEMDAAWKHVNEVLDTHGDSPEYREAFAEWARIAGVKL